MKIRLMEVDNGEIRTIEVPDGSRWKVRGNELVSLQTGGPTLIFNEDGALTGDKAGAAPATEPVGDTGSDPLDG